MQNLPAALHVAAMSDTGRVREHNEDAVWTGRGVVRDGAWSGSFATDELEGLVLAVADGVGGAAAGEIASRRVAQEMAARIDAASRASPPDDEVLRGVAVEVNDLLLREADRHPDRRGMATTYTAIHVASSATRWLNAGDSRLYGFSRGELRQITRDHTLREETGDPSIPGNIITNCFGTEEGFRVDIAPLDLSGSALFLLCSDGLSDYADMDRAAAVLGETFDECERSDDPQGCRDVLERSARTLVDLALNGGGGDNVSLLIALPRS